MLIGDSRGKKNTPLQFQGCLKARYHLDFSLIYPVTSDLRHAYVGISPFSTGLKYYEFAIYAVLNDRTLSRMRLGSGVIRICTMRSQRPHLSVVQW